MLRLALLNRQADRTAVWMSKAGNSRTGVFEAKDRYVSQLRAAGVARKKRDRRSG
jgi:hypothetical protein